MTNMQIYLDEKLTNTCTRAHTHARIYNIHSCCDGLVNICTIKIRIE